MRNCLKTIISISAVVSVLGLNSSVFGVAAFARQTGLDCTTCHASVGFPTLNTYGQSFKAGGFIAGEEANLMGDGDALSIPKALNVSIVVKIRAAMTSKESYVAGTGNTTADHKTLDMPDEFALLFGGRIAKNMGYLLEYSGTALSFKMPLVVDLAGGKLGVVPFWTDALGVGYGFENLSTGAIRNIRAVEERSIASAVSFVDSKLAIKVDEDQVDGFTGLASAATGVTAYYWMGLGHVAVTGYLPASSEATGVDINEVGFAQYVRAAITPSVANLDLALGIQKTLGKPTVGTHAAPGTVAGSGACGDNPAGRECGGKFGEQNYLGVDAQVMGTLGLPVALFVTYGKGDNLTDGYGIKRAAGIEASALTFVGDVQLIENKLNFAAGMRLGNVVRKNAAGTVTRDYADNAFLVEVKYYIARNMRISADYSKELGDVLATNFAGAVQDAPQSRASKARVMVFGSF